jgi:hypothetical protein
MRMRRMLWVLARLPWRLAMRMLRMLRVLARLSWRLAVRMLRVLTRLLPRHLSRRGTSGRRLITGDVEWLAGSVDVVVDRLAAGIVVVVNRLAGAVIVVVLGVLRCLPCVGRRRGGASERETASEKDGGQQETIGHGGLRLGCASPRAFATVVQTVTGPMVFCLVRKTQVHQWPKDAGQGLFPGFWSGFTRPRTRAAPC